MAGDNEELKSARYSGCSAGASQGNAGIFCPGVSIQKNYMIRSTFLAENHVFCRKKYLCRKNVFKDTKFAKKGILFVKFFSIDTGRRFWVLEGMIQCSKTRNLPADSL